MIGIARAINGIAINGKEWLLDSEGNTMEFESIHSAKDFLRQNGYEDCTDEEFEDAFFFENPAESLE
jgi:hypothetical protein